MNKYQWPASRLDEKEMALLFREKQKSKKSICELLRQAVHTAYNRKSDNEGFCISNEDVSKE
jgi:hypothetical protein